MTTTASSQATDLETVRGWFRGRLPQDWTHAGAPDVTVDREEITVVLTVADLDGVAGARAGRAKAFREETREARMRIAEEAQHRFGRTVSWGVRLGAPATDGAEDDAPHEELWTHVSAPTMTRLRQPERMVLDTLVDAGVARSRSDALGWCVRLVGRHEGDWLTELRTAMESVDDVRRRGPAA